MTLVAFQCCGLWLHVNRRLFGMVAAAAAEEGHDMTLVAFPCCALHCKLAGCLAWLLQQLPRTALVACFSRFTASIVLRCILLCK